MNDSAYQPTDRRAIRSRDTRWAQAIANELARRGASANAISLFGMVAAVVAGGAFFATSQTADVAQRVLWLAGGLLCQVRLLCNLFDGMVAINRGVASRIGELYNEVPDRVSDAAVFIGLGYAAGGNVALGYLAALLAVFTAYVRSTIKAVGGPNDFCGPMAKPQRMALTTLLAVYLAVSPTAWRLAWGESALVLALVVVGCAATSWRRLARGARTLTGGDS